MKKFYMTSNIPLKNLEGFESIISAHARADELNPLHETTNYNAHCFAVCEEQLNIYVVSDEMISGFEISSSVLDAQALADELNDFHDTNTWHPHLVSVEF